MQVYLCAYAGLHVCPSVGIPKNGNDRVKQFLLARKCAINQWKPALKIYGNSVNAIKTI